MNIVTQFSERSSTIKKEYIDESGKINSKRLVKTAFAKLFPDVYSIIKEQFPDKFREVVFCILNDIPEFPKCPVCGKELPLRNFVIGFQKTCSRECGNVNFHSDESVKKMTLSVRKKYKRRNYYPIESIQILENKSSTLKNEINDFLKTLNVNYICDNTELLNEPIDFYFPDKNIAIEVNGCWFHSDRFKSKNYHKNKFQKCLDKNIELIYIWEDTWNQSKNIIQNYLKAKLGIFDKEIWARKTVIKEVSIQDSRKFLDENHLQGYCNAKYRYGLYYDDALVQIMTFGYSRFKKGEIELLRFCTKGGVKVTGGASKLLVAFLKNHPEIETIISYANCDISTGHIYKCLGFKYVHTTDNWSWLYKGVRVNRFNNIRKKANELDLAKCYSAGTMKFIYYRK